MSRVESPATPIAEAAVNDESAIGVEDPLDDAAGNTSSIVVTPVRKR
jgi:hypothetical protein